MPYTFPRCRIIPQAGHQVSVQIDGQERLRWHAGEDYPRPFFFPFNGPSGHSLTRMGHPGAPNHDHHQSVWFAHSKVLGIDFWSNTSPARIRQKEWLAYHDGNEQAILATRLAWYDGHDPEPLLEQQVIAIARPGEIKGETLLELQSEFHPTAESLEFQQTNFGFLAVRVASELAEHFGGGRLTNSEGLTGEKGRGEQPGVFGRPARWMDYSGPVPGDQTEGITFFDHPSNVGYPSSWHVREDGWMGCSVCMHQPVLTTKVNPLRLRFLLHAHAGPVDAARASRIADEFVAWPRYEIIRSTKMHQYYEARIAD
ncbi:MAG: PmoA family protein [Planctomycetaceae bacterium]